MKTLRAFGIGFAILLALAIIRPVVRASEFDQATKLAFNQPIRIPGQVLPAGTYWFQSMGSGSGREVIQIYDADHTNLYATLLTIPRERMTATGNVLITLATNESDGSTALKAWFYPGQVTGHEFVYTSDEERQMGASEWSILATPDGSYPDTEYTEIGE